MVNARSVSTLGNADTSVGAATIKANLNVQLKRYHPAELNRQLIT
jgi:hypothetical protein